MIVLYFLGLLSSVFSLVSLYPIVNNPSLILAVFFSALALVSFFFFWLKNKYSYIYSFAWAACLFILTIVMAGIGLWIYVCIFSHVRDFPALAPIFKFIFFLFGLSSGMGTGNVYLNGTAEYVHTFLPAACNLGLFYFLMICIGLTPLLLILKPLKKALFCLGLLFFSLLLYLLLRTSALIFLFLTQDLGIFKESWFSLSLFWHPVTSFVSFLPWIIAAWPISQYGRLKMDLLRKWTLKKLSKNALPALLSSISILLLILFFFWLPSGGEKNGKILFEEYYSDWSKSTKPMDENWYSRASTYNYYTMRIFLNSYYDVVVNEKPLDDVDLSQFDVLLLKIPTKPYSGEAINRIVDYVREGGGLWIIGDHTNVFGSSTYLNPLLDNFGMTLNHDGIYHNVDGSFNSFYGNNPIDHPIMHKVPLFLFATPCSLLIRNPLIRIVIPGLTTKSYRASYTAKNFFPDTKPDLNIIFGSNTLMAAGPFGEGRIAVFTDSTVFSNFYMYMPGKPELALATITWLNHKQPAGLLKATLLVAALILFSGFIFFYIKQKASERNFFWPIALAVIFLMISLPLIDSFNQNSFGFPQEKRPLAKASFLAKYCNIYLTVTEWKEKAPNDFNTFYIWGQRVGLRTIYADDLEQAATDSKALFIILPNHSFESYDLAAIDSYLKAGGKVFVLDTGEPGSTAADLLRMYGLSLKYYHDAKGQISSVDPVPQKDFSLDNNLPLGIVEGDYEPLLIWKGESGNSGNIFAKKTIGKGTLYIFGGVLNFSTANFGYSGFVPSGEKEKINNLILDIYNRVLLSD